jgi:hypothetical protein
VEGPAVPFSHYSPLNGSTAVPFVIPSEAEGSAVISASIRCWMVALPSPLSSRPERSEVEGSAVISASIRCWMVALPSPLSSRPERSEVEGSAVPQTPLGNVFLQGVPNPKNQPTPPVTIPSKYLLHPYDLGVKC